MNYNFLLAFIIIVVLFAGFVVFKPYRFKPISSENCCFFLDTWTGQPYSCIMRPVNNKTKFVCYKLGNVGDLSKLEEYNLKMGFFNKSQNRVMPPHLNLNPK